MSSNMFETLNAAKSLVLDENRPDDAFNLIKEAVVERPDPFTLNFIAEWIRHLAQNEEEVRSQFSEIIMFLKDEFPDLETLIPAKPYFEPGKAEVPKPQPQPVVDATAAVPVFSASSTHEVQPKQEVESEEEVISPIAVRTISATTAPDTDREDGEMRQTSRAPELRVVPSPEKAKPENKTKRRVAAKQPTRAVPSPIASPHETLTLTFYGWQREAIARAAQNRDADDAELVAEMLTNEDTSPLRWARYKHGDSSPSQRITMSVPMEVKEAIDEKKEEEGVKTTTRYVRKMLFGKRAEKA